MTVYVDDAGIKATVTDQQSGRVHTSRWYHLFSDQLDPQELHDFAVRIGMKRAWFQRGDNDNPVLDHYDLTEGKRKQAIAAGATPVDLHRSGEILSSKRAALGVREATSGH